MTRFRILFAALLLMCGQATANSASSPVSSLADGRSGRIWFASGARQLLYYDVLNQKIGPTEAIFGDLLLPANVTAQTPAVVIAHGSLGVNSTLDYTWAQLLNQMGIAVFIVDSFTGRGVQNVYTNQATISYGAYITDAFFALKLLATHPAIDKTRIGILGFSRGANVALYSAVEKMRGNVISDNLKFAVHLGLYPYCNFWTESWTGAPVRLYLGASDDYTPALTCTRFEQRAAQKGYSFVATTSYAGADHGFDANDTTRYTLADAEVQTSCQYLYDMDKDTYERFDTGMVYPWQQFASYLSSCTTRGAHLGGQAEARRQVRAAVKAQLQSVFRLDSAVLADNPPADLDRTLNWAEGYYRFTLWDRSTTQSALGYRYRCYANALCVGEQDGRIYLYNNSALSDLGRLTSYFPYAVADGF